MATETGISWTDSTFNPWIGCTKVGPGCDHCYAETLMDKRLGKAVWGAGQQRVRTSAANWNLPKRWNQNRFVQCSACGHRAEHSTWKPESQDIGNKFERCPACWAVGTWKSVRRRVFCASLADVFDNEVDPQWRSDLLDLIDATPNLDWLLLTKRIGNVTRMLTDLRDSEPRDSVWGRLNAWLKHGRPPENIWLGATVVNQAEADRDIPKLLATPAAVRFLSVEPMLGAVDASPYLSRTTRFNTLGEDCANEEGIETLHGIDWVICGGESGNAARPMQPDWARSLRDQCKAVDVPFHFKQWGEWAPNWMNDNGGQKIVGSEWMDRMGKKAAGSLLDGREEKAWPVRAAGQ